MEKIVVDIIAVGDITAPHLLRVDRAYRHYSESQRLISRDKSLAIRSVYCPSILFTFLLPFSRFLALALDLSLLLIPLPEPLLLLLLLMLRVGDSSPAEDLTHSRRDEMLLLL